MRHDPADDGKLGKEELLKLVAAMRAERDHVAQANVRAALEMAAMYDERQRTLEAQANTLEKALAEARAASTRKDEFLAKMSHELRTPLNGIIGMAHVLGTMGIGPREAECTETILESAGSLLEIINDLLDLSKIASKKVELRSESFDLHRLIGAVPQSLSAVAVERSLHLTWSIADDVPCAVVGDPRRLRQVLVNLVGNALKFTERGRITLECRLLASASDTLELRISDTGCGIPEAALADIFESFRQLDNSASRAYGGSGLGLAISRDLVELMGGELTVESELEVGSTFTARIPLRRANEDEHGPGSAPRPDTTPGRPGEPPGLELLVVEDHPVNQRVAKLTLERLGHVVTVASSGEEALEILQQRSFDAIFMDCQMPGIDGLQTTQRIRATEAPTGVSTRIIALTANAMPQDRARCFAAGMDDFLAKPIEMPKLRAALEHVTRRSRAA